MTSTMKKETSEIRALSGDEMDAVTGGLVSRAGSVLSTNVVMRPDGGTCTDPWPKGPFIPLGPFGPRGPRLPL